MKKQTNLIAKVSVGITFVILLTGALWLGRNAFARFAPHASATTNASTVADLQLPNEKALAVEALGKLPLSFEANRGQTDARVKFLSRGDGYNLFLTANEMVMTLRRGRDKEAANLVSPPAPPGTEESFRQAATESPAPAPVVEDTLRITLVNANPHPRISPREELPGKINYFLGNDRKQWRAGVQTYGKVHYAEVYPGVDLLYYGTQRQLEYDFVVAPGADPGAIRLRFAGAERMRLDAKGEMVIETPGGELRQQRPVVYQEVKGERRNVAGSFAMVGEREIAFELGAYDKTLPLVIDPVLTYSTYLGGQLHEAVLGVAVDATGIYVSGPTQSPTFPGAGNSIGSGGLFKTANAGGSWTAGTTGLPIDWIQSLAVDPTNPMIVYVSPVASRVFKSADGGSTWTQTGPGPDFGVSALAVAPNGPNTVLASSPFGGGIYKSTNGGTSWTLQNFVVTSSSVRSIAIDPTNADVIYAGTFSGLVKTTDGGATWTLINTGLTSTSVSSLVIDPTNTMILYAATNNGVFKTINGGANWSATGNGPFSGNLAIDPVTPTTIYAVTGGLYKTIDGGASWTFTSVNGATLQQIAINPTTPTTLYVGSFANGAFKSTDGGTTFAAVNTGISTRSTVTALALSPTNPNTVYAGFNRATDVFVSKLNPAGSALIYSTYLGGNSLDLGSFFTESDDCLAVDAGGNAYITGDTYSEDFPVLNAFQNTKAAFNDIFLTKLNAGGALAYSTFLGGSSSDVGSGGIAVDNAGNAYIAGYTFSTNFPTRNAFQATGSNEAFVAKFNPALSGNDSLLYSTYLGGNNSSEFAYGVDADNTGNVYVAGTTFSNNFPIVSGFQTALGGSGDGFLSKLDTNLSGVASLLYSTYSGGSNGENAYGVAAEANGKAHLVGTTNSINYPTLNAFQSTSGGSSDAFVTTIDTTQTGANSLRYSTFLGGASFDQAYAVAVNAAGQVYVTGVANSANFPFVNPMQQFTTTLFVTKLNPAAIGAASVSYSTYIAGAGAGIGYAIALDGSNNAYAVGAATNFFSPLINPFQAINPPLNNSTFQEGLIVKIADELRYNATPLYQFFTPSGGTANVNVTVTGTGPAWAVSNLPSWLTAAPMGGTGNGVVTLTAASNTGGTRTAQIFVAGQIVYVFQAASGCSFMLGSTSQNFTIAGGTGSVSVTAGSCSYGVFSPTPWIGVTSFNTPFGNSTVNYSVAFNPGPARTGTIQIADQIFTVTQDACAAVTINPQTLSGFIGTPYNQTLTATGGAAPYSFAVSAGALPGGLSLSSGGVLSGTPAAMGSFNFTVRATDANGCQGMREYTMTISGNGLMFYPLPQPVRLLETRSNPPNLPGCNKPNTPIAQGSNFTLPARIPCSGIPANAAAVTGNITVVPAGPGYLTLYPSDAGQPTVANSNFQTGEITNNVFTVGLGAGDGAFKIFSSATTEVIVDVTGYYAPPGVGGLYFHPLATPVRLLETRTGFTGCIAPGTPLAGTGDPNANPNLDLELPGRSPLPTPCNSIPATAQVLVGNATSVLPSGDGYLTIYPSGGARPTVASSNYAGGDVINGPFAVKLGADGKFKVYTFATTHLVVDILGYYSEDAMDANGPGLLFTPLPSPVRLLETRPDFPGFPLTGCTRTNAKIQGNLAAATHTQSAGNFCGLPGTAQAIVGNVSVVNSEGAGFLTLFPANLTTAPLVATSNYPAPATFGYNRHYFVGLSPADGKFKVLTQFTTDLILDASGYFAP